jgi:hypothetical protein
MQYTVGKDGVVRPYDGPKLMSKLIRMQNSLDNDLRRPPRYRRLVTPRAKDEDKEESLVPRTESPQSEDAFSMSLVRASSPDPTPLKSALEPPGKIRLPSLPPVLDVKKLGLEHLQVLQERFTAAQGVFLPVVQAAAHVRHHRFPNS